MFSIYESIDDQKLDYASWVFNEMPHRCIHGCSLRDDKIFMELWMLTQSHRNQIINLFGEPNIKNRWIYDDADHIIYFKSKEDLFLYKLTFSGLYE